MTFIAKQEPFTCEKCGKPVDDLSNGSYRNHCPFCLYSKHVDKEGPGDRLSECGGLMMPLGLIQSSGKGWILVHECITCGKRIKNKAAPDDDLAKISGPYIEG